MMKPLGLCLTALTVFSLSAGGQGGPKPNDLGARPLAIGEPGVAWYTTWQTGWEEAQRSNRPILFMAAAAQCGGIPGVF